MTLNRRQFVGSTAGLAALQLIDPRKALASAPAAASMTKTGERVAVFMAPALIPYDSLIAKKEDESTWVQIDLGSSQPVDAIKLYPGSHSFPLRFKVETSDDPTFATARMIVDATAADFADPVDYQLQCNAAGTSARHVRFTATRLRKWDKKFMLSLSKIDVLSAGKDVAQGRPVTGDPALAGKNIQRLTRPPRPMGEDIITDNPGNVIPAKDWKPVAYKAATPVTGVALQGGLFQTAMENNIGYLLDSYSVDELLRQFRNRAGKPNPAGMRKPGAFWEEDLAGSNAGRFLMGAGNALRWVEHPELRNRMNAVIDGIEDCRQPNGFIMGYPEDTIFHSERAGYTRAWLTHGLMDCGYAGATKVFPLLRGFYDWFDRSPHLPKLMRGTSQGNQGMVGNTRVYFSPVGKAEDLQVVQRYYQENYWLAALAKRDEESIWQYPYDRPHCYLLTDLEAYLDLYRATGHKRYLDANLGAWDLYHDKWQHVGGTIAICEFGTYPPRSYKLHEETGELCGNAFWSYLNQRLHLLDPQQEKYVNEIEKSIYNVALPNQAGTKGIAYHARLVGKKDPPDRNNTCCEGQGTRMLSALPEFIYTLAPDGLYVDLFEASTVSCTVQGKSLNLRMNTKFPFEPQVELKVSAALPVRAKIRVRVPAWASAKMAIKVNGADAKTGSAGTYVTLDRTWKDADTISFTLPIALRMTRYEGVDQTPGHPRYALEYGPILMALVGAADASLAVHGRGPEDLLALLKPKPDQPLHFSVDGDAEHSYIPYWQVAQQQPFTCFPIVQTAQT